MMNLLAHFILVFGLFCASGHARAFDLSQRDKQAHIGAAVVMTSAGYAGLRWCGLSHKQSLWSAAFLSMTVGMIKEIRDPWPDREDLAADLSGTGLGLVIPVLIEEW